MQISKIYLFITILSLIVATGCAKSGNNEHIKQQIKKHNFIVLLDLSDRLQTSNQVERDIALINNIFNFFKSSVKSNFYIKSIDEFKIVVAPQRNTNNEVTELENQLRINMEALKINQKKKAIENFEQDFKTNISSLYKIATANKQKSSDYFGADIWQYFNDDLQSDLSNNAINHLFIITDGYLYFENYGHTIQKGNRHSSCLFMKELRENGWETKFEKNDYGIVSTKQKYPNLEIMVLEVNPKDVFLNENDLLQKIWKKWLGEMDINKIEIHKISPMQKLNEKISNFLKITAVVSAKNISNKNITKTQPQPIENIIKNDEPVPINIETLQGLFVGSINGGIRQLEISSISKVNKDYIEFRYTIKGLGNKEKDKKGSISLERKTIFFETIGKGTFSQKNGKYILSSNQNEWEFTQSK